MFKILRRKVLRILIRIVNHIDNQLPDSAKLHWTKAEGGVGTECLVEYSPAQPPMLIIRCKTKVEIKARRISVTDSPKLIQRTLVRLTGHKKLQQKDDQNISVIVYPAGP